MLTRSHKLSIYVRPSGWLHLWKLQNPLGCGFCTSTFKALALHLAQPTAYRAIQEVLRAVATLRAVTKQMVENSSFIYKYVLVLLFLLYFYYCHKCYQW